MCTIHFDFFRSANLMNYRLLLVSGLKIMFIVQEVTIFTKKFNERFRELSGEF